MLLGIDIGGTTISLGLVQGTEIVHKETIPSFKKEASLTETLDYLSSAINNILVPEVDRIGIGVPTVVDQQKGILYDAANIPSWKEVHLKDYLESRFGKKVNVNNDANCYALGAASIKGYETGISVCITLGTGVGMGVIVDGKLLNGCNTGVGELSCLPYRESIIEDYCSRKFFDDKGLDSAELAKKARGGEPSALATFKDYGKNLAALVNVVMLAYDPDHIIIGGGIANNSEFFHDSMIQALEEIFPYKRSLDKLDIVYIPQPETAIVGASLL